MKIIKCNDLANKTKNEAKTIVKENKLKPCVVIIKANDDKASNTYVKRKIESMMECGIEGKLLEIGSGVTTQQLIDIISRLNTQEDVTSIIVQKPLYKHLNEFEVLESINPSKDIDCLTSANLGLLAKGKSYIEPATPRGIVKLLFDNFESLSGKNVLMIGRSEIVGLPLSIMLQQLNATVTLAHSHSNFNQNDYDIVVSATGKAESIVVSNPNAFCVDVGINFKNGKQVGDFAINEEDFICDICTAPKGGIGLLTSAMVCLNAAELALKLKGDR